MWMLPICTTLEMELKKTDMTSVHKESFGVPHRVTMQHNSHHRIKCFHMMFQAHSSNMSMFYYSSSPASSICRKELTSFSTCTWGWVGFNYFVCVRKDNTQYPASNLSSLSWLQPLLLLLRKYASFTSTTNKLKNIFKQAGMDNISNQSNFLDLYTTVACYRF
jgi:hypothetical protein